MFGFGKKWQNKVLIEGEKEAMALAQIEGFPDVNPDFDCYPVDVTLKEKKTFWKAMKKAIFLSERYMYNLIVKVK